MLEIKAKFITQVSLNQII